MFNTKQRGKIKNNKIMCWRIELSCYNFNIVYCSGAENIAPDSFSRSFCAAVPAGVSIAELHDSLCHPGITCMLHFVRTRNLPFSVEEVRQMTKACRVCAEHKPQFHKSPQAHLIKATQSFERLNLDFKGPLKSNYRTIFFLNVIDEYSRFPFVFLVRMSAHKLLFNVYVSSSLFLGCQHVHSDRGSSFMSAELHRFFLLNNQRVQSIACKSFGLLLSKSRSK